MNETFIQNQWPWPTISSSTKRKEMNQILQSQLKQATKPTSLKSGESALFN